MPNKSVIIKFKEWIKILKFDSYGVNYGPLIPFPIEIFGVLICMKESKKKMNPEVKLMELGEGPI